MLYHVCVRVRVCVLVLLHAKQKLRIYFQIQNVVTDFKLRCRSGVTTSMTAGIRRPVKLYQDCNITNLKPV